jgi:hypothetical protein
MHRDLPGGGVYDCTIYGAWGQTSWFLLANSMFLPHKTSKTAGSGCVAVLELAGNQGRRQPPQDIFSSYFSCKRLKRATSALKTQRWTAGR